MRGLLLASVAAAAVAIAGPVWAADMPLKAPLTPVSLWDTGGMYLSINTGAEVAQANVNGGSNTFLGSFASGNVRADGGVIGGGIGYMRGNPAAWYGVECDLYYRNIAAGVQTSLGSAGIASRWEGSCGARMGFDPSGIAEVLSGLGLGSITLPTFVPIPPPGVHVAPTTRTFLEGGLTGTGVSGDFGVPGGSTVAFGPYLKLGTLFQSVNAVTGKPAGGAWETSVRAALYDKGFEAMNFLDPQHNVVFKGDAHISRAYMAELSYKFAPGFLGR